MAKRTSKAPDIAAMKEIQYLGINDIQKTFHVGTKKAQTIAETCRQETELSGFECLQNKIYYKRLYSYLGISE